MEKFAILFRKGVIKGPEFQIFAYLDGIINTWNIKTSQISKLQCIQQISVSNILLCQAK
jgi:hypothetical protein